MVLTEPPSVGDSPTATTPAGASWRFATPEDAPFLYDLAVALDPRVWRFSRHGTAPHKALDTVGEYERLVVVEDEHGQACGFAGLVNLSGDGRCVQLDLHAAPTTTAPDAVRSIAHELIEAVFLNAPVRHVYVERFDDDPDLVGHLDLFELDVEIPEFAHVGGRLATRLTFGASRPRYVERSGR